MLAILVVETNIKNKSDDIYVRTYLKAFYQISETDDVIKTIYLEGKDNYNNSAIAKKIKGLSDHYLNIKRVDETVVVFYFIDTDDLSRGPAANENRNKIRIIEDFCSRNDYRFVWFHEVIEQTFVGKRVSNKEKGTVAESFARKNLQAFDRSKLRCANYNECRMGTSNIDMVLKQFFPEKTA